MVHDLLTHAAVRVITPVMGKVGIAKVVTGEHLEVWSYNKNIMCR